EQYYLLYPLILMMVWSRGFRAVLLTIGTMLCLSFLASVWGTNHFPDATFYLLPMRAWELFVGGFCAFVLLRKANKLQSWNQLTAVCGLLLILLSVFWFDDATPFPGLAALLPTLGTAAIIVSATPATFVGRALRFSPIVALGLISYSAYLWHQPLFAFARIRLLQVPTPWQFLLLSVMTLALAWLSWRFIETPFRNRTKIVTNTVIRSALIAATVLLALGITLDTRTELPFRAEFIQLESTLSDNDCQGSRINYVSPEQACIHNAGLPLSVALWGDSHAMALTTALSTSLATVNTAFTEFTYQGCPPVPGLRRIDRPDECARFNGEVLDYLLVNSQIRSVILVARWPLYLEGSGFDNREGGSESMGRNNTLMALPLDVSDAYAENPERVAVVLAIIRANIIALMDAGKQVILVDPIPEAGWHVSALLAREQLNDVVRIAPLSTSFAVYQERNQLILELFDSLSAETDLIRIRPQELLCQSLLPQRCVNQWNGEALYIDSNHLNQKGAMMVTELIVSSM
ncbi:MAG: acyltransferase family protein, partial [Pseudohongiellaceae bacterium]